MQMIPEIPRLNKYQLFSMGICKRFVYNIPLTTIEKMKTRYRNALSSKMLRNVRIAFEETVIRCIGENIISFISLSFIYFINFFRHFIQIFLFPSFYTKIFTAILFNFYFILWLSNTLEKIKFLRTMKVSIYQSKDTLDVPFKTVMYE